MIQIPVAVVEFMEGGKAIWVHNDQGSTVLRIQCTGKITVDPECENLCAHSDINVVGNIAMCIPKPKEGATRVNEETRTKFLDRMNHLYRQTDGTMKFPSSAEGDSLKMIHAILSRPI